MRAAPILPTLTPGAPPSEFEQLFDYRTLAFLFAVATLIFLFVTLVLWRMMPQERSLRTWIAASAVTFVSGLLLGLTWVPNGIAVTLGNATAILGVGLVFTASRRLLGRPTRRSWDAVPIIASLVAAFILLCVIHNTTARLLVSAVFIAPFLIAAGWEFWRGAGPTPPGLPRHLARTSERISAVILAGGGLGFLVRGVIMAVAGTPTADYETTPAFLLAFPYVYAVLVDVWLSSVLALHVSGRLQRQLLLAKDRAMAANRELEILSRTDPLTKLDNRLRADEILESEINRARRYGSALSVVIADLDNFKTINDRFGHQTGDQVLVRVAERLRLGLRSTDSVARWGGEEFLLILPHTDSEQAEDVAQKVRLSMVETPIDGVGHVTASFGVSTFVPGDSPLRILARADDALYDAKRGGRNRVCVVFPDQRAPVRHEAPTSEAGA